MNTTISEPLRPFTLGEILDRTAQLYRRNFLLFAGVAAVPTGAMFAVFIPLFGVFGFFAAASAKGAAPHPAVLVTALIVIGIVAIPVGLAATVVSQAALVRTAITVHMGQKLKIREALKSVWPRFWRYAGVLVLQGVFAALIPAAIAGGVAVVVFLLARLAGGGAAANSVAVFFTFLLFGAAFVVIVIRGLTYSLALPACLVEEKPAWGSFQRSVKLSKGARGRIFLMFMLVYALSAIVTILGYIPTVIVIAVGTALSHGTHFAMAVLAVAEIMNVLMNFTLQTLITPVYVTSLVLFYYDQRIRTEGYDIEWMMERAGLTGAESAPAQSASASAAEPNPGTVIG
jgi:hypothetical protein